MSLFVSGAAWDISTLHEANSRFLPVPPGTMPTEAYSSASGNVGTDCHRIAMPTSLAVAISRAWPRRPKPVISVQALTPTSLITSEATRFNVVMLSVILLIASWEAISPFRAVAMIPVPRGLVKTSRSPGRALALVSILSG